MDDMAVTVCVLTGCIVMIVALSEVISRLHSQDTNNNNHIPAPAPEDQECPHHDEYDEYVDAYFDLVEYAEVLAEHLKNPLEGV